MTDFRKMSKENEFGDFFTSDFVFKGWLKYSGKNQARVRGLFLSSRITAE